MRIIFNQKISKTVKHGRSSLGKPFAHASCDELSAPSRRVVAIAVVRRRPTSSDATPLPIRYGFGGHREMLMPQISEEL